MSFSSSFLYKMKEVRITPKKREALEQLGITSSEDILQYYPYRYDTLEFLDYDKWEVNSHVIVEGTVLSKPKIYRFARNKSVISFELGNDHDTFRISVFNQPWYLKQQPGSLMTVIGKYEGNRKILAISTSNLPMKEVLGIKPVYSLKDKVKPKYFSELVAKVLEANKDEIVDYVNPEIKKRHGFMDKYEALKEVHFPTSSKNLTKAINYLKYEEFFKFQTYMLYRKNKAHYNDDRFIKSFDIEKVRQFVRELPFSLTEDQKLAVKDILNDLSSNYQMCRLLQGDVGCGKTIVSFVAMYACHLAGYQAVLMAPTEILAKQHYQNILKTFKNYDIKIELLYSNITNQQRKAILERIRSGETDFVVGTHAVFQQDVEFSKLGLIITDEQHRFGVKQRQQLQDKGPDADLLLMSATPIPRTLATSLYGDMDVSTIVQTPNAHKVIHTTLIPKNSFMAIVKDIEKLLDAGNQMYVVCATIEKSTELLARNVNDVYNNLNTYFKGRYKLGLLHGQMSEEEKDAVQESFARGEIDILVTTTVIEVGVDVKSANIMVIYDANRFGLSQLHQLRGRIGRGEKEGYCYLLTNSKEEDAITRLNVIVNNTDGFKISYYDLQLRGPGDILGYRQSGLPTFMLGNVVLDNELLQQAREDGKQVIANLDKKENENIRQYLLETESHDTYYLD